MKTATGLAKLSLVAMSVLYSTTTLAALAEQQGFSGEIAVIAGYAQQTSNLNSEGEKVKTGDLNSQSDSESSGLIAPLGNVQYTFGEALDKQVFVGTSSDDVAVGDIGFEIGYSQGFDSGMVMSVSYLPSVMSGETWQDPYLLDTEKKATDVSGNAVRFQIEAIAGSNFSAELAYGTTKVDEEQSGNTLTASDQKLLDRNGNTVYLKSAYQYAINQTNILIPSVTYISHSTDGEAMSFDSYGADLTYFKVIGKQSIALSVAYSHSAYDALNPVFNETREDNAYSAFLAYERGLGFGLDSWSFISLAGYSQSVSNIEFYDEEGFIASVGIKYNF
ncbi:MAG: DUF2860 domain-containing protein [Psychromonas sp.]|nr:DUF2860 domain-containing protein [Alteromonadales bacterium]MCP5078163.1 DUF2860 domain-containing protein [Psychromonas sp.]